MRKGTYIIISLILLSLFACRQESTFEGVWLGTAYELDKDVEVPFASIIRAEEDGSFNRYSLGNPDSNWSTWKEVEGVLWMDTVKYPQEKYDLSDDQFTINKAYKSFYVRLKSNNRIDTVELKNILTNGAWKSQYDEIYFDEGGALIIQTFSNDKTEKVCWSLVEESGSTFLIKKGNQVDCDGILRFPEQVVKVSENSFNINRWEEGEWKLITYNRTSKKKESFKLDEFQLCNPYLYRNNPRHRYYYHDTFYKGGLYKINKLFDEFYKAPEGSIENGLIKVEFIVNCQGKPGNFSMLELDMDYREKKFDPKVSTQLLTFTKSLKEWEIGKNKKGEYIDTYRFLTYKIRNGEVVEIFP